MNGTRLRSTVMSAIAILSAACFLTMNLGSASRALAADAWETWPKKPAGPGIGQKPAKDPGGASDAWKIWPERSAEPDIAEKLATDANKAAQAGDAEEKKAATGSSYGTIAWIALGIATAIGIGIAAGGGGGGGGVVTNPGHQ